MTSFERYDELIEQGDVLDNLDPKWIKQLVPTGSTLVDDAFQRWAERRPLGDIGADPQKYRVYWEGDVVGWIENPRWDLPNLQGAWSPTINPKGKDFAKFAKDGSVHPIIVEGSTFLHGEMKRDGDLVTVLVLFAK